MSDEWPAAIESMPGAFSTTTSQRSSYTIFTNLFFSTFWLRLVLLTDTFMPGMSLKSNCVIVLPSTLTPRPFSVAFTFVRLSLALASKKSSRPCSSSTPKCQYSSLLL